MSVSCWSCVDKGRANVVVFPTWNRSFIITIVSISCRPGMRKAKVLLYLHTLRRPPYVVMRAGHCCQNSKGREELRSKSDACWRITCIPIQEARVALTCLCKLGSLQRNIELNVRDGSSIFFWLDFPQVSFFNGQITKRMIANDKLLCNKMIMRYSCAFAYNQRDETQ